MNFQIIEVVTGIILIYLLLSLLITAVQEYIASVLKLRSKVLEKTITNMLSEGEDTHGYLPGKFFNHPLIKSLSKDRQHKPSYLSAGVFTSVVKEILQPLPGEPGAETSLFSGIQNMPQGRAKSVISTLWESSGKDENNFAVHLGDWFTMAMDRSTGIYKRLVQKYIFVAGLAAAILFNADSLRIYRTLSTDGAKRVMLAEMASGYVEMYGKSGEGKEKNEMLEKFKAVDRQLDSLSRVNSILGMGWTPAETHRLFCPKKFIPGLVTWTLKIFGWIITAMAVSLGAPFWFDLLSKFVYIRNSGKIPEKPKVVP